MKMAKYSESVDYVPPSTVTSTVNHAGI